MDRGLDYGQMRRSEGKAEGRTKDKAEVAWSGWWVRGAEGGRGGRNTGPREKDRSITTKFPDGRERTSLRGARAATKDAGQAKGGEGGAALADQSGRRGG